MKKLWQEYFTAIDLETTGGKAENSGILEVGLTRIREGKIEESFTSLVKPVYAIPRIVKNMTGISEEMVLDAPAFSQILKQVIDFIDCDIVILHNAPFDLRFLSFQVQRMGLPALTNPILCTVKLGELLSPDAPNRRLETLAAYLDIPLSAHHRAWSDADATARIFVKYLNMLKKLGVETYPHLFRWMQKQKENRLSLAIKKEETQFFVSPKRRDENQG